MEKDKGKINDYRGLENLIKIVVQECDCPFSQRNLGGVPKAQSQIRSVIRRSPSLSPCSLNHLFETR